MAVSKRLRYEVLRRDNHACKYCGAAAPDATLTVDHVVPVALGGSDDPSNLVAACVDCNAGKAATNPDGPLVEDVKQDALRWALAMRAASELIQQERITRNAPREAFAAEWHDWTYEWQGQRRTWALPPNWENSIDNLVRAGLTAADLVDSVGETMRRSGVRDSFRYFCGVAWAVARDKQELATEVAKGLAELEEDGV